MPRNRILQVIGRMDRAGAETLVVNILRSLDRSEYQFDFLVRSEQPGHYDHELARLGCRLFRCNHHRNPLSFLSNTYRIIRNEGPYCAVHSHLHYFDGVALSIAMAAGVPVRVSHSHSTVDGCNISPIRNGYRQVMRQLIRLAATHKVGVSECAYLSLFGEPCEHTERSIIAKNGIPLECFHPSQAIDLRKELRLSAQSRLIGHVGRMAPVKNHEFLLDTFAEVRKRDPSAELVLVGDGPLRSSIEQQAEQLGISGHVHLLGIRGDVSALMPNFNVFVFPSVYEGLGLALVEAQAAGVTCLASTTVPREVDMGCSLLQFRDVAQGPLAWSAEIESYLRIHERSSWNIRLNRIRAAGYDIRDAARTWMRIYESWAEAACG